MVYNASTGQVRIWWDTSVKAYRIVTPFNRNFVEMLKTLVPSSDRVYEAETRTWTVTERFLTPVQQLAEKVWGKATVITREQSEKAQTPPATAKSPVETVIVDFVRLLSYDAIQKAYRHAALENHPDRGGDMDKMSRLNALWERLKRDLYNQTGA